MPGLLEPGSPRLTDIVSPSVQCALEQAETVKAYEGGQLIHARGDETRNLSIVRSGAVRLGRVGADGRDGTVSVMGPGQCFGVLQAMTGRPRTLDTLAVGPTRIGHIDSAKLDILLDSHPELTRTLLTVVVNRLHAALDAIDDLRRLPLPVRTGVMLLEMSASADGADSVEWNQSDLALTLGASRVAVGRALKALEAENLVVLRYGRIDLPNPRRLKEWVARARGEPETPR